MQQDTNTSWDLRSAQKPGEYWQARMKYLSESEQRVIVEKFEKETENPEEKDKLNVQQRGENPSVGGNPSIGGGPSVYRGTLKGEVREGVGENAWAADGGMRYFGEWKRNFAHGQGMLVWEWQRSRGEGQTKGQTKGQTEGQTKDESNIEEWGGVACGRWHHDKLEGVGTAVWPDGTAYQGEFSQHRPEGEGVCVRMSEDLAESVRYEGSFVAGYAEGHGRVQIRKSRAAEKLGDVEAMYVGEIHQNARIGKGFCTWVGSRAQYDGQWADNLPHGKGRMEWCVRRTDPDYPQLHPPTKADRARSSLPARQDQGLGLGRSRDEGYKDHREEIVHQGAQDEDEEDSDVDQDEEEFYSKHRYVGEWEAGCMHGVGTYYWTEDSSLHARWENNEPVALISATHRGVCCSDIPELAIDL
eukprot:TRINITY_DN4108_c0_g1_i4.p1 TRINITY_DN4108_c0_g1~~TRINITY_DN4108_c0_g1_i4.p1  ORF type:complete len:414 (+),score=65.00 TRINITY_DN4108_c0_g1_i4:44-1285(+)